MDSNPSQKNRPLLFFLLLFILSIPIWLIGSSQLPLPVELPVSALMSFCPLIAAAILTWQQDGSHGIQELLQKTFDHKKITNKIWYIPILLWNPILSFLSYVIMRLVGLPLPEPNISLLMAPLLFIIFFLSAVGEELGWMGYTLEPLQNRWGALRASILLGLIWAIWHVIPDLQLNQPLDWILWHRLGTIGLRILIVWIYNNAGRSVFAAILFHDMNNLSWAMFPNFGSHYDPMITSSLILLTTGVVSLGWRANAHNQLSNRS
jgi:membrane protease YdiL (CAAX protease family)